LIGHFQIERIVNTISKSIPEGVACRSMSHTHLLLLSPRLSVAFQSFQFASEATEQHGGQSDRTARNATSNMTQIEITITRITLALTPNSSILNKPHPPPLILAASRCPDNHCRDLRHLATAVITDKLPPSKYN
jgi:hypothetical protein